MALDESALNGLLDALHVGEGTDLVRTLAEWAAQQLIDAEAATRIGADPYERVDTRVTHRNGTRPRTLTTKAGDLELAIPKLRRGSFFLAEAMAVDWTMSVPCQRGVFYQDAEWPQAGVVEDLEELAAVVAATGCYPSMWRSRPIGLTEPEPVPSQGVWDGYLATTEPVSSVAQVLRALMQQMSDVRADPTELRAVYSFDQLFGFRQPPL